MEVEIYTQMNQVEQHHWWFVARRKIIRKVLESFLPESNNLKILEIGCGTGGNLALLSEFGEVSAMELDNTARKLANKKKTCEVKKGALPNNIPFTEKFDLICLFDVLEHIEDDHAAIASIKERLNEKGEIFITVPAYQFLWSFHDVEHPHKRRYTLKNLKKHLLELDFNAYFSSYFNCILFPIIATVRKLLPWKSNNNSSVNIPPKYINIALKKAFSLESEIIPKYTFPFGVSIIILAKKQPNKEVP